MLELLVGSELAGFELTGAELTGVELGVELTGALLATLERDELNTGLPPEGVALKLLELALPLAVVYFTQNQ